MGTIVMSQNEGQIWAALSSSYPKSLNLFQMSIINSKNSHLASETTQKLSCPKDP